MILIEKERGDVTMFMVSIQDVSQKAADDIIRAVRSVFSQETVLTAYQGTIEKGDVELTIPCTKGMSIRTRHDITKLCACIYQTLSTTRMMAELSDDVTYVIFDNSFPYELFNCIAQRVRMIESAKKNKADASISATCGNCHLPKLNVDCCNIWAKFDLNVSTALNRELCGINLSKPKDEIRFSSPQTMTCEFSTLDIFMHMLTIEQLIDVHGLI